MPNTKYLCNPSVLTVPICFPVTIYCRTRGVLRAAGLNSQAAESGYLFVPPPVQTGDRRPVFGWPGWLEFESRDDKAGELYASVQGCGSMLARGNPLCADAVLVCAALRASGTDARCCVCRVHKTVSPRVAHRRIRRRTGKVV